MPLKRDEKSGKVGGKRVTLSIRNDYFALRMLRSGIGIPSKCKKKKTTIFYVCGMTGYSINREMVS